LKFRFDFATIFTLYLDVVVKNSNFSSSSQPRSTGGQLHKKQMQPASGPDLKKAFEWLNVRYDKGIRNGYRYEANVINIK
jgi:hypothetical protein